jgi:membrane protease YdiL (CAAX protease family)
MGLLVGADRKLRLIWRAVIFWALTDQALPLLLAPVVAFIADRLQIAPALTPAFDSLWEITYFLIALIGTVIFARYEQRPIDSYGLPISQALGMRTVEGALVGIAMAGAVAVGMYLLGGMQVHGLATSGTALAVSALAWLGSNICVGVAEELLYRSYLLQTLWRSIGFWPASIVIAVVFAGDHYFYKSGENIWDVITLTSLSLWLCYSVLRTGTLWFAVGFHVAFDYMQVFIIGTPNGSQMPIGRLLEVSFEGPAWLTGGVLGTEASLLMYPLIGLAWLYVWYRFRG